MAGDNDFKFETLKFNRINRHYVNTLTMNIESWKEVSKNPRREWATIKRYCFFIQNLYYNPQSGIFKDLSIDRPINDADNKVFEYYVSYILSCLCKKGLRTNDYDFPQTNWLIWDDYGLKMFDNIGLIPVEIEKAKFDKDESIVHYIKECYPKPQFYLIKGNAESETIKAIFRIRKNAMVFSDVRNLLPSSPKIEEVFPTFRDLGLYEKIAFNGYNDISMPDHLLYNEVCQYVDFNHYSLKSGYKLLSDGIEDSVRIANYPYTINYYLHYRITGNNSNDGLIEKMKDVFSLEKVMQRRVEEKNEEERIAWEKKYKYKYNTVNRCSRDSFIIFDEINHTYTVDGKILQSVTNIVENCFPKFDAELHAKNTAAKMGITPEEVIAMWERKGKESRDLGTAMHKKIEKYYQGEDSYEDDAFSLFKVFAEKVKLLPYRTEWAVYDTDYNIAGTIDFVDYQDGKYTIYDWKRSDKIIANGMPVKVSKYQEKGLYPLEHLENCAYYHYALQLSLYKFILEKNYGIEVSDLRLGIFHPSYDKPYVLRIPYLENEVKTLMELRSEVVL